MILKKLSIINYRNIREASLELSPKINCLIGSNGMGKTNVLDAIYFLSFCKSATGGMDTQMITHGEECFVIDALYEDERGDEEQICCGMKRGSRKHFKRNRKEYKRLSQHIGLIPLITISPADTAIIDSGSEIRRKMMDVVIAQSRPGYMDSLIRYNNALQQRNALLKMEEEPDATLMELWEEEMAREGEAVYAMRKEFVETLTPKVERIYALVSGERESITLNYVSHCQRGPLIDVIRRDRQKDRIMGFSLHGIHRDDIELMMNGYPLKREGSQGQSKTFAISLKLAQYDFLKQTARQTAPILLLDDVFDKLDADRVEQIVSLVADDNYGQIFITDTNRDHLDDILRHSKPEYRIFHVEEGVIKEV